jgi:hypothetical protein
VLTVPEMDVTKAGRGEDPVTVARRFLIRAVSRGHGSLPTYGELAAVYGDAPTVLSPLLQAVASDCAKRGEPDLTALLVNAPRRPSTVDVA